MAATVRDQLLAQSSSQRSALLFEDRSWSWREVVQHSCDLHAALQSVRDPGRPFHVGALLDNVPEMSFLLGAAALGGSVLVGLNTTRRGEGLLSDVRRSDCQVVVTEPAYLDLLAGVDVPVLVVGSSLDELVSSYAGSPVPDHEPDAGDLLMLIFTSGTSGEPKACRITHEKVAFPGAMLADRFGLTADDVCYVSMPLFHSNAVMAGWAPALAAGATVALARRFSASGFLADVRRFGATYANYVGKPLTYVLATPEQPDDPTNPLRVIFGNEAAERDIDRFGERFGCVVVDSYSSTENAVIVQRLPGMPAGSLGQPLPGVAVLAPDGAEVPDAVLSPDGALLNADAAIGELVNTTGAGFFAGYYNDAEADAERMRGGMYWSGDLAYRDAEGFVYFAGRSSEWLRVDGENLATAPIERVLMRFAPVVHAAVYGVPAQDGVGDAVVAALVLSEPFDAGVFAAFLAEQPDLGTKSWPSYVRLCDSLPQTATNKVLKRQLQAEGTAGARPLRR